MENNFMVTWICSCLFFLLINPVFSQKTIDAPKPIGPADDFKLTVEPSWVSLGQSNNRGKSELEKSFFPGYNRMVEYFFSDSLIGIHGFRIDTVSMDHYIIEVAWVTNFKEEFKIEKKIIPASQGLAAKLWNTYYVMMKNYTSRGIAPISFDGYSVTFRCVVEDFSLWTFYAKNPHSLIKDFTTTCNGIVKDVQENGKIMYEEEHINQLDKLLSKVLDSNRYNKGIPGTDMRLE